MYFEMEDKAVLTYEKDDFTVSITNRYGETINYHVCQCPTGKQGKIEMTVERLLCDDSLLTDEQLREVFWVRKDLNGTFLSIDFRDGEQGLWYQPQYQKLFEQLAGILEVHVYAPPKRDDVDLHEALSGESFI